MDGAALARDGRTLSTKPPLPDFPAPLPAEMLLVEGAASLPDYQHKRAMLCALAFERCIVEGLCRDWEQARLQRAQDQSHAVRMIAVYQLGDRNRAEKMAAQNLQQVGSLGYKCVGILRIGRACLGFFGLWYCSL